MKNITLKIILLFILNFNVNAESIGESLNLDTVYDEHISTADPRLASLIISARSHKNSMANISYNSEDGYFMTRSLIKDFEEYGISYSVVKKSLQQKNKVIIQLRQDDQ